MELARAGVRTHSVLAVFASIAKLPSASSRTSSDFRNKGVLDSDPD